MRNWKLVYQQVICWCEQAGRMLWERKTQDSSIENFLHKKLYYLHIISSNPYLHLLMRKLRFRHTSTAWCWLTQLQRSKPTSSSRVLIQVYTRFIWTCSIDSVALLRSTSFSASNSKHLWENTQGSQTLMSPY